MRGSEFAELTAFMAIMRERSFRRAALRLGLSPSALSHTIRALEERLGTRLLNRTTRSVAPTEAGSLLFARLDPAIGEIDSAVAEVGSLGGRPAGRLRINAPRLAIPLLFMPLLGRFRAVYPDIRLEFTVDDDVTDVVADGFDAGVRIGRLVERDMIALRLTPDLRTAVVGAPALFGSRSQPQNPQDLRHHPCINYRWSGSGALYRWPFDGPDGRFDMEVEGALTFDDTGLILDAALAGLGLAALPEQTVRPFVESGRLVSVLEPWSVTFGAFYLYYPGRRHMPAALRALVDFLNAEARY